MDGAYRDTNYEVKCFNLEKCKLLLITGTE